MEETHHLRVRRREKQKQKRNDRVQWKWQSKCCTPASLTVPEAPIVNAFGRAVKGANLCKTQPAPGAVTQSTTRPRCKRAVSLRQRTAGRTGAARSAVKSFRARSGLSVLPSCYLRRSQEQACRRDSSATMEVVFTLRHGPRSSTAEDIVSRRPLGEWKTQWPAGARRVLKTDGSPS